MPSLNRLLTAYCLLLMIDPQWRDLLRVLRGQRLEPPPVGFIVDSPWLPGWAGTTILDYLTDDACWLDVNLRACRRFPQVMFLPGFWAEYGMCTEPSAFGAKCVWPQSDFPYPERILDDLAQVDRLKKPDCRTDGLLPFVLKRLEHTRARLEAAGHRIRFATSRGPMNIASYLLGQTDFLTGLKLDPQRTHKLLRLTSDFICDWLVLQARAFDSIEGVLILDDLVGFVGAADFREFALPYLKQIFAAVEVPVKVLHNDAHGLITARHLAEVGVNLFNFSFEHSLGQMRELAGPNVTLLGNLPPRDCLAQGSAEEVRQATAAMLRSVDDPCRILFSAGGGMPPGVPSENIDAFCAAIVV